MIAATRIPQKKNLLEVSGVSRDRETQEKTTASCEEMSGRITHFIGNSFAQFVSGFDGP